MKEYRQFCATKDKQYTNPKVRAEEDEKRRKNMLREWDEGVRKQQEELVRMGVPGVKVGGKDKRDVEKQKKILAVLGEMVDEEEGAT